MMRPDRLMRAAATHGLGIVLSVLMACAFGVFANRIMDENKNREAQYREFINMAVAKQTEAVQQSTILMQQHDLRARESWEKQAMTQQEVVTALRMLSEDMRRTRIR